MKRIKEEEEGGKGKKKLDVEGKVKNKDRREQKEEEEIKVRSEGRQVREVGARRDKWEGKMLEEEGDEKEGRQKVKGRRTERGERGRKRIEENRGGMLKIGRG